MLFLFEERCIRISISAQRRGIQGYIFPLETFKNTAIKYLMDDIALRLICLIKNINNIHFDHLHSCYRQNTPHKKEMSILQEFKLHAWL